MRTAARWRVIEQAFWTLISVSAVSFALYVLASAPLRMERLTTSKQYIVVDDDGGGNVATFAMWYARIKEAGIKVRIIGECDSACTLVLSLPKEQFCVEPTASLGFHLAAKLTDKGPVPLPEVTKVLIRRYYPPAVQEWLAKQNLSLELVFLSAEDLIRMNVALPCHN